MKRQYELIGGLHHGEEVKVNDASDKVETADIPELNEEISAYPETYVRRHLEGKEFGGGYDCFAVSTDDNIDTEALALLHLHS
jgi:hypothetical protein